MPYRFFILSLSALTLLLNIFFLPGVLRHIKNDPEVERLAERPGEVFTLFSECKIRVKDEARCYQAYSAAVQLANRPDCSAEGIALKLKFKKLVEHTTPQEALREVIKACPQAESDIRQTDLPQPRGINGG